MILTAVGAAILPAAIQQPVKVDGGMVSGTPGRDSAVQAFRGIPFAAPPVGDLRWKPPAPVKPWSGVRAADQFPASCTQAVTVDSKLWTREFNTHA